MPLRIFSRGSPKTEGNSNDTTDGAGKEPSRLPLFPLQDVSWNSFSNEGKTDLLNTPRSVVKWLSSTPLPDPPFFESQENFAFEKPLFSLQSNQKMKLAAKDSKLKFLGAADAESTATSLRSLASSGGLQDALIRNPNTEQKSFHATPNASTTNELDTGTSGEIQVVRSLKYSQATAGAGTTSQPGSTANPPLPATSLNSCAQTHFEIEEDPNFWKDHNVQACRAFPSFQHRLAALSKDLFSCFLVLCCRSLYAFVHSVAQSLQLRVIADAYGKTVLMQLPGQDTQNHALLLILWHVRQLHRYFKPKCSALMIVIVA